MRRRWELRTTSRRRPGELLDICHQGPGDTDEDVDDEARPAKKEGCHRGPLRGGMEAHALLCFPDGSLKEARTVARGRQSSDESK